MRIEIRESQYERSRNIKIIDLDKNIISMEVYLVDDNSAMNRMALLSLENFIHSLLRKELCA